MIFKFIKPQTFFWWLKLDNNVFNFCMYSYNFILINAFKQYQEQAQ